MRTRPPAPREAILAGGYGGDAMEVPPPAEAFPPRTLILMVLGAHARRLQGWMPIAGLIRLMDELGVDEQSVRSAISRLRRRELVVPERRGGAAGYRLSASGQTLLARGDARIYDRPRAAPLRDGWALVAFSVPDRRRSDRHLLRSQLSWLGFGNLSSAVWIAPWSVERETREMVERLGLTDHVRIFQAHHQAFGTPAELVAACWDLEALRQRYDAFLDAVAPIERRLTRADGDEVAAFVDHVTLLSSWRPLPFLDAGLPAEALPADWPGLAAWEAFHRLAARLEAAAARHVADVVGVSAEVLTPS